MINRAPVFALWGAVVAERLGYDADAALTLGKCMAGLTAQKKGRMLGIYKGKESSGHKKGGRTGLGEEFWVDLCTRPVPARNTEDGVRAVVKDKPIEPEKVQKYLEQKFGDTLGAARAAMEELAQALEPEDLNARGYDLYAAFRPEIPRGKRGWGAKGELDLALIRSLAKDA
jgi:hypothetical protein